MGAFWQSVNDFLNSDFLGLGMVSVKIALGWLVVFIIIVVIIMFLLGGGEDGYVLMEDKRAKFKLKKGTAPEACNRLFEAGYKAYEYHTNTDPRIMYDDVFYPGNTALLGKVEAVLAPDLVGGV